MSQGLDKADVVVSTLVGVVSMADIQNVISIIMLSIQCVYILLRFGEAVYQKIKHKKIDEIKPIVDETLKDLEDLTKPKKKDGDK